MPYIYIYILLYFNSSMQDTGRDDKFFEIQLTMQSYTVVAWKVLHNDYQLRTEMT